MTFEVGSYSEIELSNVPECDKSICKAPVTSVPPSSSNVVDYNCILLDFIHLMNTAKKWFTSIILCSG